MDSGFGSTSDTEFFQNLSDMDLDGGLRDEQGAGDLSILQSLRKQFVNIILPRRESRPGCYVRRLQEDAAALGYRFIAGAAHN